MEEGKFPEKEGRRNTVYTLLGKKSGCFFFKRPACHPFPNELKIFLLFNQCEIKSKTAVNRIKEVDFLGSQW